ncbi:MAG: hypothetical protein JW717_05815 [Marinilabiliaceae bacterium]|nr:hypothetical protein [Marinilabiliaceae bacterium]
MGVNGKIIERYGNLVKEEVLELMHDKILPNTFVLEAPEPFPGYFGYYNDIPTEAKPLYVYFVLKRLYTLEEVTRAYQNIKKYFPSKRMHAAAGTITIYNETYDVLRIRHLDSYDEIAALQSRFQEEGFEFAKKPGRKIGGKAIIRIKKFFILDEKEEGIFFDMVELDHAYFVLPRFLKWMEFEDITKKVKYNWDKSTFDAAMAHYHNNLDITDMVRIYNPKITIDYIKAIRDKYLERIK